MHHFTWNPKSHAIFSHTPSPSHSLPPTPTFAHSVSRCVCDFLLPTTIAAAGVWETRLDHFFSANHFYIFFFLCRFCSRRPYFIHVFGRYGRTLLWVIFFFCFAFARSLQISFYRLLAVFFFITHFSCQVVAIWMCLSVAHLPTLNSSAINSLIATEQWAVSKKKRERTAHTHTWRSRSVVWFPSTCTETTGHMAHRIMCELSVEVVQDVVVSGSEQENHDDSRSSGRVYGKANI